MPDDSPATTQTETTPVSTITQTESTPVQPDNDVASRNDGDIRSWFSGRLEALETKLTELTEWTTRQNPQESTSESSQETPDSQSAESEQIVVEDHPQPTLQEQRIRRRRVTLFRRQ